MLGVACCVAGAGCRKAAPEAKAEPEPEPYYEQGLKAIAEAETERMKLVISQVQLAQVLERDAARQSRLTQELAALDDELVIMQEKYKSAKQELEWRMTYGGVAYSEDGFRQLVSAKLDVRNDTKSRLDKYDASMGEYAQAQQRAAIRLEAQNAKENTIRENLRESKRGLDLKNIHKLWDRMDESKLEAVSEVLRRDANDPGGLSDRVEREAATTRGIKTSTAEVDAFLNGTGGSR